MSVPSISVAMCTFNGERYLSEQLDSILAQTRLPDELIVFDDGSVDHTVQILSRFAEVAPFRCRIQINPSRVGPAKNFEQAIQACAGDLIALSDQDDVWYANRIERLANELADHSEVGLVFSDAHLVDSEGLLLDGTLWSSFGFTEDKRKSLEAGDYTLALLGRFMTGATAMFRSCLRPMCLPIGALWLHDEWLASAVPLFAELRSVAQPLIRYRKHHAQAIGPGSPRGIFARMREDMKLLTDAEIAHEKHWSILAGAVRSGETLVDAFDKSTLGATGSKRLKSYRACIDHFRFRASLPSNRAARVHPVLSAISQYRMYARTESIIKDLLSRR